MPLSMALLRSETLVHLGMDATDLDATGTTNLDLLINRSWWDVISQFDFKEEEKIVTFVTVDGTRQYLIQTIIGSDIFDAVRQISLLNTDDSSHTVLDEISILEYETNYNEQTSLRAKPSQYFHNGGYLYLAPTPDDVYTLTVYYKYILTDLSAGNPSIPQDWHESILYGAVQRGQARIRDYESSSIMESKQTREILKRMTTTAKENKENNMASVSVMRNPYSVRK